MKRWLKFTCKLFEVKDGFFTAMGSPYRFIPQDPGILDVLRKFPSGRRLAIRAYRKDKDMHVSTVHAIQLKRW